MGAALAVLGLSLGAGVGSIAIASPAQAACKSSHWSAGVLESWASADTRDCPWESRSYARHGNRVVLTPWFSGTSYAYATVGYSNNHAAWNQFR